MALSTATAKSIHEAQNLVLRGYFKRINVHIIIIHRAADRVYKLKRRPLSLNRCRLKLQREPIDTQRCRLNFRSNLRRALSRNLCRLKLTRIRETLHCFLQGHED